MEYLNELNWKEKIIVTVFKRTFDKVYNVSYKRGMIDCFNYFNK